LDFLSEIWNWLSNFLSSLDFTNSLKPPAGIPLTVMVIGSILAVFLLWVVLKNALFSVLVLIALGVVWWLLAPLGMIPIAYGFSWLDVAVVAICLVGLYIWSKKRGK
jgi:hypothetical protein